MFSTLLGMLHSKIVCAKLMFLSSGVMYVTQSLSNPIWDTIIEKGLIVFILALAVYILWIDRKKEDEYSKDQTDRLIELTERVTEISAQSTYAVSNATDAINRFSQTNKELSNQVGRLADKIDRMDSNN